MEPAFDAFASQYANGQAQLLYTRLVADMETPVSAYLKLGFNSDGVNRRCCIPLPEMPVSRSMP